METSEGDSAGPYRVLLYYQYAAIDDPGRFVEDHREMCGRLHMKGRVIVAEEGINGTVSGTRAATGEYMKSLRQFPGMDAIEFKSAPVEGHVFAKLSVKRRPEIVTLGLGKSADIDPPGLSGGRLSPMEFRDAMAEEEAVVLDGRNRYESDLGRFEGAVCPDVENFREFPDWIRENLADCKDRVILAYCTGGIRCEKLTGWMRREGFSRVFQLDGGIINYGVDQETRGDRFEGECYVFDERIGVPINHTASQRIVSICRWCGESCHRYLNCAHPPCNARIFVCESCETREGRFCDAMCRSAGERRATGDG